MIIKWPKHLFTTRFITRSLLPLILILLISSVGCKWTTDKTPFFPHQASNLKPDPNVRYGRLDNGLRYVLMHNKEPKDRISIHLQVLVGSLDELDGEQGIAHYLEHMLFDGSTNFPPGELVKYFQRIGMQFGPDANAHTGFNSTVYDILLPKTNIQGIKDAFVVLKDYAQGALLLPKEIEKERKIILAEKTRRDSVGFRTFKKTLAFELPGSIVPNRLPIGETEIIQKADHQQLKNFYNKWYQPANMVVVIVGDFDPIRIEPLIQEQFGQLPQKTISPRKRKIKPDQHKGIKAFYHYEKEDGNTSVSIETIQGIDAPQDSFEYRKNEIIRNLGFAIVQNRLKEMIGKSETPFTSADTSAGVFLRQVKYAQISADCQPENWEKSLSTIENTLRSAFEFGFLPSELTRVKKDYIAQYETASKKAGSRNSKSLAQAIMRSMTTEKVFLSPTQKLDLFAPIIKNVSLDEVFDAFQKAWQKDHRIIVVTGNADLTSTNEGALKKIKNVYSDSQHVAAIQPHENQKIVFPYLTTQPYRGEIPKKNTFTELNITQVDWPNGFRLNLKPTDFKDQEILMTLAFGKGRSSEPVEKPGLSILSEAVINQSGVGKIKKTDFDRVMTGKNTLFNFGIHEDHFAFKGVTIPAEMELLFQLFYTQVQDLKLKEDAYNLAIKRFSQSYKSMGASIDGMLHLKGYKLFAQGDGRFGYPDFQVLNAYKNDDIDNWVGRQLQTSSLELSIVGDFDPDKAIALASQYFGMLPARQTTSETLLRSCVKFPENQKFVLEVNTKIPKAMVVVAFPTTDFWNIKRTRSLSMLSEVLSERLRVHIREKLGAAYSPFSYNRAYRAYLGYGVFYIIIYTDPQKTDMVVEEVQKVTLKLVENGLTEDELNRALDPLLNSIKDMRRTNPYWLNSVLERSKRNPQQLEWAKTILEGYGSIQMTDVWTYAKTYLQNDKMSVLIIKPSKMK